MSVSVSVSNYEGFRVGPWIMTSPTDQTDLNGEIKWHCVNAYTRQTRIASPTMLAERHGTPVPPRPLAVFPNVRLANVPYLTPEAEKVFLALFNPASHFTRRSVSALASMTALTPEQIQAVATQYRRHIVFSHNKYSFSHRSDFGCQLSVTIANLVIKNIILDSPVLGINDEVLSVIKSFVLSRRPRNGVLGIEQIVARTGMGIATVQEILSNHWIFESSSDDIRIDNGFSIKNRFKILADVASIAFDILATNALPNQDKAKAAE